MGSRGESPIDSHDVGGNLLVETLLSNAPESLLASLKVAGFTRLDDTELIGVWHIPVGVKVSHGVSQ
jgi:hypothetical protein